MKRFFALITAMSLILALAACAPESPSGGSNAGGGTSTPSTPSDTGSAPSGEVYELTLSNHDSPTNPTAIFMDDWAAEILEATNGRLKINVYHAGALANVLEGMDMVENGTIDMCWSAPAVFPGRFNTSLVTQLPLINCPIGETGGKVLWDMYSNHTYFSDEWSDFKVIALHTNSIAGLMTSKKPDTAAAFQGLRVRTTTPSTVEWLKNMGGVPMSFQITETFENLEKNVADGTIGDWTNAESQHLYEVTDYGLSTGIMVAVGCIVMNKDSYNNIPEDLREIFDQYIGEYASVMGARYLGDATEQAIETCTTNGVELWDASPELQATMEEAAQSAIQTWIGEMDALGYDGQQIYQDLLDTIAKYT